MSYVQGVRDIGGDELLRLFVGMAHEHAFVVRLTLNVSGATISGLLIGRDKWLEELGSQAATAGQAGREFGEALLYAFRNVDLRRPEGDDMIYGYIHLKDARVLSGGALLPQGRGVPWRGRISEVSGWSLGALA